MRYAFWTILLTDAILGILLLFTKRLSTNMYPIALVLLINVIEEGAAYYFKIKFRYNLSVYFFFNPFEYACFAWFFYINIDYKLFKRIISISVIMFFSFIISYLYFFLNKAPLPAKILLDYVIVIKGMLLSFWFVAYVINIFDQIGNYKKLNVFILLVASAILFYYCFSIIFFLSEIYLINYSESHNVPLAVMLNPQNQAHMYASQQYAAVNPLLALTNILLYLCIFVALIKSLFKNEKTLSITTL